MDRRSKNDIIDTGSVGWGILGFFFPFIGLILFLAWTGVKPRSSKSAGIGALTSVLSGVLVVIVLIIVSLSSGTSFLKNKTVAPSAVSTVEKTEAQKAEAYAKKTAASEKMATEESTVVDDELDEDEENGSAAMESSNETKQVNTKNLTENQAITWVENYLLSNNVTAEAIGNLTVTTKLDANNYLLITTLDPNAAAEGGRPAGIFRIDSHGNLQIGNPTSVEGPWTTVSEEYQGTAIPKPHYFYVDPFSKVGYTKAEINAGTVPVQSDKESTAEYQARLSKVKAQALQ
jgi:hypothetical protein